MRGLDRIFDRRLRKHVAAPLVVALSGGGDSLALLLAAKVWAGVNGRSLLALTVDHGLTPASPEWTAWCADTAARLGVGFRALSWRGDKPATGLPAAARAARHALLADAARDAGASVILMGHTADDLAEAAAMRAGGSTVPDPAEWSPSPAWPEGRGVFLLRPMLGLRRAAIRDWLRGQGETWIDDPTNEDHRFARARARASLSSPERSEGEVASRSEVGGARAGPSGLSAAHGGQLSTVGAAPSTAVPAVPLPLAALRGGLSIPASAPPRHVAAACLCAAGTARPPRGDRLDRLVARLHRGEVFTATLAGARVRSDGESALFVRDAGRTGLPETRVAADTSTVWDGRFEISANRDVTIAALAGHAARLPKAQRDALRALPAIVRPSLPVILAEDGAVSCPILAETPSVRVRALALPRFEAAAGCVDREPAV